MSRRPSSAESSPRRIASQTRAAVPAAQPPARRNWRQLLKHHVRLQRVGFDFRFVLIDPQDAARTKAKAKSKVREVPVAPKSRASQGLDAGRLALMRTELRMLMKRHSQARSLARHLAYFERAMQQFGARAFDEVPVDVLRKALIQIEFLVTNWSALGLAEVRSRLAIALSDREAEIAGEESVQDLRNLKGHAVSVQDATVSQFMAMQQSWLQPAPGGVPLTPIEEQKAG